MAYLWHQKRSNEWSAEALVGERHRLWADRSPEPGPAPAVRLVRRVDAEGAERWLLMSPLHAGVRVNGQWVPGLRVLEHQDEIWAPGVGRLYFSTEEPAKVEPFAGPTDSCCARCKSHIEEGTPAVRCPHCGVFHHQDQDQDRPCWTYAERCSLCDQPTRLDGDLQWTPEQF